MASFKAKEVVRILEKLEFIQKRQTGSHLMMFHPTRKIIIPVPIHTKDIKKGLLRSIIKQAQSTEEEFIISKKTPLYQSGVPLFRKLHTSAQRYQSGGWFSWKVCKLIKENRGFSTRGSLLDSNKIRIPSLQIWAENFKTI